MSIEQSAKPTSMTIQFNSTDETVAVYANSFDIASSFNDVTISFGRMPPKLSKLDAEEVARAGTMEIDALVQVTFSPQVLPQLIKALIAQKTAYEQGFGQIREFP